MATKIIAGNASDGVRIDSDNTGTLELKTGSGAGTTALSIDASQNVAIAGTLTIAGQPAGGNYALQSYVAPATWTKPAGLKAVKVTVVGAGGNGGNSGTSNPTSVGGAGAGGGGGGAVIDYIPAPSIPGPVSVTAGPGTNSFGAFCSATAGTSGAAGTTPGGTATGFGTGGTGSGGGLNYTGTPGGIGFSNHGGGSGTSAIFAGASAVGGPGPGATSATPNNINGAGGAGGGSRPNASVGTNIGGTGGPGIVIVEEFY